MLVVLVVGTASPSSASCAAGSGPAGSAVVFRGTAVEQVHGYARFAVAEVWAGPDLAPEVWVQSGQTDPGVSASTDADFEVGRRYVVGASRGLQTNACSVSWPGAGSSVQRPTHVRAPVANGLTGDQPAWGPRNLVTLGVGSLSAAAVVGVVLALVRQRRTSSKAS